MVRGRVAFMLDGIIVLVATLCVWSLIILVAPIGLDALFVEGLVSIVGACMYAPLAMPLLGLFFFIAHRMPYDYL